MEIDERKLIFCTGSPGSTWSRIITELSRCTSVDTSDNREWRIYEPANHSGNYFGPEMEFGAYFFDLRGSGCSREEILIELGKPYEQPYGNGYRLLKSHVFSYNLPYIRQLFPTSKLLLIWRDENACYDWWIEAGGFDISFPDYSWYLNETVMKDRIKQENACIVKFAEDNNISLTSMSLNEVGRCLGLIDPEGKAFEEWSTKIPDVLIGIK